MGRRITTFKKRLIKNIQRPEMKVLPGQLAFFFILTMIPLMALVGSIAASFHLSMGFWDDLLSSLPKEINSIISSITSSKGIDASTIIFFISALFLASNGTQSMILTSNNIYNIKGNKYYKQRLKAIMMMIVLIFLLTFVLVVPVFGSFIINTFIKIGVPYKIYSQIWTIYHILKFPLSFIFMFFTIKLLYFSAPDTRIKSNSVNYGALFTTVSWIIFTQIYSWYIEKFGSFSIYGGISNLIVLMWWLYFLAYFFVLGMALNASRSEDIVKNQQIEK